MGGLVGGGSEEGDKPTLQPEARAGAGAAPSSHGDPSGCAK